MDHLTAPGDDFERTCGICRWNYVSPAMPNKCQHKFCFDCLLLRAEVLCVCPICRTSFTFIMHDVKSDVNYKSFYVPSDIIHESAIAIAQKSFGSIDVPTENFTLVPNIRLKLDNGNLWEGTCDQFMFHLIVLGGYSMLLGD